MSIHVKEDFAWFLYFKDEQMPFDEQVDAWICSFQDFDLADQLCYEVVKQDIITHAKRSNPMILRRADCIAYFYIAPDNIDGHKNFIKFIQDKIPLSALYYTNPKVSIEDFITFETDEH